MKLPTEVFFFGNGNTAVTDSREQIPELQQPWLRLFVRFLQEKRPDVDIEQLKFNMPDLRVVRVKKYGPGPDDWNWQRLI